MMQLETGAEELVVVAELASQKEHNSLDNASGGAGLQGRERERAKEILDLAATRAEMARAGRSGRRRRLGTYRAPVAVASHPKLHSNNRTVFVSAHYPLRFRIRRKYGNEYGFTIIRPYPLRFHP
jgi:hypothetical protein